MDSGSHELVGYGVVLEVKLPAGSGKHMQFAGVTNSHAMTTEEGVCQPDHAPRRNGWFSLSLMA